MLAQSFISAAELGITEPQREALQKVLVLLETGKITHEPIGDGDDESHRRNRKFSGLFNMSTWAAKHECGTVCCIGGTAEIVGNVRFGDDFGRGLHNNRGLYELFMPSRLSVGSWSEVTPAQAARALRSYLTTGNAKWAEAVA